jgi:hypothetical protein
VRVFEVEHHLRDDAKHLPVCICLVELLPGCLEACVQVHAAEAGVVVVLLNIIFGRFEHLARTLAVLLAELRLRRGKGAKG